MYSDEDVVELKKRLGARIALARKAAGLTQIELGALIDVDKMTVSRWERGLRSPNGEYLYMLSRELGCTADFLCGLSDVLEVRS